MKIQNKELILLFGNESLKMKRIIEKTEDGSHTLYVPELNEHYHSTYGAIQESKHVYINAGFHQCTKNNINILEIGFGTGLNALLTLMDTNVLKKNVFYQALELYPLDIDEARALNYNERLNADNPGLYEKLHESEWEKVNEITPQFTLLKNQFDFSQSVNFHFETTFDVVYFDAFAPDIQPEMWTQEVFNRIFTICNPEAIITTYCAKGVVRRSIESAGFLMERLPGPPGKREILRGRKL